jgi:MAD (mothers against decapentaplegic) family protein 6/7
LERLLPLEASPGRKDGLPSPRSTADSDDGSVISFSTYGTQDSGSSPVSPAGRRAWCKLAYWEECCRVGRQFPVSSASVDVFCALPKGNGLCLASLFGQNKRPSEATARTRAKIGEGVLLSRDFGDAGGGVWLYNRTDYPVFVNSPTLGAPPTAPPSPALPMPPALVFKVPPAYSVQIFDFEKSRQLEKFRDFRSTDGPFDPYSVRVSFAKGWGSNYSRQFITSCPCWIEILLEVSPR